jgi:CCR4-NOT transcription complex subunit 7/8
MHLLKNAGIDFEGHKKKGIDPEDFGSVLTSSGMVLT